MARIESYPPGSFCWAELATTDLEAAKKLYCELFGWSAVDYPIPGGGFGAGTGARTVWSGPDC